MKKGLIIIIVAGILLISTGIVGGIMTNNSFEVGVNSTDNNAQYEYSRFRNNQNARQYDNRSTNQRRGIMRGSNYKGYIQCPYGY